ncbi:pilus assembly protein, PilQ [Luminiphilus syltensis NOR5-1B]|uniref:Pilus assembly protein, PilQ n=1 Tax=Luminiphilus syltensis NOR5-1B TaxID=565045 RepID=B8KUT9_9GAMM|nr:pilus assembly protein PilP [Luminiphilus syltensis]EED34795.1 pilus assembly protein, PilQ [Luminiphilus syltensis NOR5-1B]
MKSKTTAILALLGPVFLLSGCMGNDMRDLDAFMAEKLARPGGVIQPVPTFQAYEAFAYSATTQRSPFDRPVAVKLVAGLQSGAVVRPDPDRPRQFLEQFTLDSLQLVGALERDGKDWSLIKDPDGGIHRVQVGEYLGRDHGKIVETTDTYVSVIEIVSDGTADGWVERPRTIDLLGS